MINARISPGAQHIQHQPSADCILPIHKLLHCKMHPKEALKFYCNTCEVPICSDCLISEHTAPLHTYQRISDVESTRHLDELDAYVKKAKESIVSCGGDYTSIEQYMDDLNDQLQMAKKNIGKIFFCVR